MIGDSVVKEAPSLGRLAAMVVFALTCFGLLLFLWLAFGGPIRRGLFITTCQDVPVLDQVAASNPLLGTLTELLNLPKQNCPSSTQDPVGGG